MAAAAQGFVPGRHKIDAYGGGGFRFADMSHRGSILVLPSGIYAAPWSSAADIDEAALKRVFTEAKGAIELLLFGTGESIAPVPTLLRARLRAAAVMSEAMATGAAVRTYNMLLDEDRKVAAALVAV
jgi:uncharacterized protein